MQTTLIVHAVLIVLTVTAAVIDWRTGHIPNWLTYPAIAAGPILWLAVDLHHGRGLEMVYHSLIGLVVCSLAPLILWKKGGLGGGDVKLLIAIGGIGTWFLGIEAQLLAAIAGAVLALGRLAWDGKLLRTLGNSFFLAANPVLPKKWRKEI